MGKARGLARFAEMHRHRFGRIQLIDVVGDHVVRLDLQNKKTREQVKTIVNNDSLIALYNTIAL